MEHSGFLGVTVGWEWNIEVPGAKQGSPHKRLGVTRTRTSMGRNSVLTLELDSLELRVVLQVPTLGRALLQDPWRGPIWSPPELNLPVPPSPELGVL